MVSLQSSLLSNWQPILNSCPALLPDRKGQRDSFFESILVAHQYLKSSPTVPTFLNFMIEWTGRSPNKSNFYKQNILHSYYLVGLIPYTLLKQNYALRLVSELPIITIKPGAKQLLRLQVHCLSCFNKRLSRMIDVWQIMSMIEPFTQSQLREKFDAIQQAGRDDIERRVRFLLNLGALQKQGRTYKLTDISRPFIPNQETIIKYQQQDFVTEIQEVSALYNLDEYDPFDLW